MHAASPGVPAWSGTETHRGGAGFRRRRESCHASPSPSARQRPDARWSQAGLPTAASTGARAATLGVFALLRISVFTYFVE